MTKSAGDKGKRPGELSSEDRTHLKRRLSGLGERLGKVRSRDRPPSSENQRGRGIGYALRMSLDMVLAVVVGGAIGWFLDRWLGTAPVLLLLFGVLGVAAGFLNVARTYREMAAEAREASKGHTAKSVPFDDDED